MDAEYRKAVYVISVAAELAGVHQQTLRIYERKGLVKPHRTSGNTRRYSAADIARLRRIQELTQGDGVNLAGAKKILNLEEQLHSMQSELEKMADRVAAAETGTAERIREMASAAGAILPASAHRNLEELLDELRRRARGAIPLGPAKNR